MKLPEPKPRNPIVEALRRRHGSGKHVHQDRRTRRQNRNTWKKEYGLR